jgi:hypothetical protein
MVFFNKLYGFCCCAYQNKQNIKSSFFFVCLGLDLYIQKIILQKRNETLFFKKQNETQRYLFWNRYRKQKRNKYFSETKRKETKKKTFFNPWTEYLYSIHFLIVIPNNINLFVQKTHSRPFSTNININQSLKFE